MEHDTRKVTIVGLGHVGATAAYSLLTQGIVGELVLYARDKEKAYGEKLDLEHGLSFLPSANVVATDNVDDIQGSDVVVFTAGAAQAPGETRLDLLAKNRAIVKELMPKLVKAAPSAIFVMVTNPVDILTYDAATLACLPEGRVFGTGTMLDTARFRFHMGEFLNINPRSIHAYILGEHGDSSFPVLSSASVGGQPLDAFPSYSKDQAMQAFESARQAAYNIIKSKGSTYYAIGAVISKLVRTILSNSRSVLPVSIPVSNYYGEYNVSLSVPCIVGRKGVEQVLRAQLDKSEEDLFHKSAAVLREHLT